MSVFTKLGNAIAAPQDVSGLARKVDNAEMQTWMTELEAIIDAAVAAGNFLLYSTKAELDADLNRPANSAGLVLGDSAANDGYYKKIGASGTGSWTKLADPTGRYFLKAIDDGGTANAIAVTTVTVANETQFIAIPINITNTASPITVAFNGGSALTIKTQAGNDPAAGGLIAGTTVGGFISGTEFHMLSDQASTAIQAAAEAAQVAAEAAQVAAEAAAATAAGVKPYTTRTAIKALTPTTHNVVYLSEVGRHGLFITRAGSAPVADAQEGVYFDSDTASYYYERLYEGPLNIMWFGAVRNAASSTAIQAAIDFAELVFTRDTSIYSPPGLFKIDADLTFRDTVSVVGDTAWNSVWQVTSTDTGPHIIMGDQTWWDAGGGTNKGFRFSNIRIESSGVGGEAQGHGVYMIGVNGGSFDNLHITGFDATGKYGLVFSGNPRPGDGLGVEISGATGVKVEGHYNTLTGCYVWGNSHGAYFGGDWELAETGTHDGAANAAILTDTGATWTIDEFVGKTLENQTDGSSGTVISNTATTITATLSGGTDDDWDVSDAYYLFVAANGQSNSNTITGGAIRQNTSRNLTLSATNNNTFVGVSFEAKTGTDFGVYGGATRCQDNKFYNCRFEGTYDVSPWRFINDVNIKRNFIDLPTYGANYSAVNPYDGATFDPGLRNYCRQMDLNGNLILWGPRQYTVSQSGMGMSGTTAQRPVFDGNGIYYRGTTYYDTTLGVLIYWDGAAWKRVDTNATV